MPRVPIVTFGDWKEEGRQLDEDIFYFVVKMQEGRKDASDTTNNMI